MSAPAQSVRPLPVICADAARIPCPQCRAQAAPCVTGAAGTTGIHVARAAAAYRAGRISGPDFTAATGAATVFCNATIVFGGAR